MDAQIRAVLEQVNTLFYYLSKEAEAFLNSSNLSADDKVEYNTDIVKLMNSSRFTKCHIQASVIQQVQMDPDLMLGKAKKQIRQCQVIYE